MHKERIYRVVNGREQLRWIVDRFETDKDFEYTLIGDIVDDIATGQVILHIGNKKINMIELRKSCRKDLTNE